MAKQKPVSKPQKVETRASAPRPTKAPIDWSRYTQWLHILIITATFWTLYYNIFDHKPDINGDNFAYTLLGRRLAAGLGFTNATDPKLTPHTHFSPGYPLMIAAMAKTIGDDQDTISFMNGVMMYLSLIMFYFITKRLTGSAALGFAVAFVMATNPYMLRFSTITMSEVPYIFISHLAILLFIMAVQETGRYKNVWFVLSILLMAYAYYIKTNAMAFIVATGAYFFFAKDWKRMVIGTLGVTAIIFPWYLRTKRVGSNYIAQMKMVNPYRPELGQITPSGMMHRMYDNIIRYMTCDTPLNIFPKDPPFDKAPVSYWILGIMIVVLALWGLWRLKDFKTYLLAYLSIAIGILIVFPTEYGLIRYMTPFTPLVLMLAMFGIKELFSLFAPEGVVRYIPYSFLLLSMAYTKSIGTIEDQANEALSPNYANYFAIARWIKDNTPKGTIVSARKPDMFIYYSDRMCIGDKPSLDDKDVMKFFRDKGVDYVVIEQLGFSSTAKYLVPAVEKNPDKFDMVLHLPNPDTYLLKFKDKYPPGHVDTDTATVKH